MLYEVITVGNFDGVHLGHRELLRRTVSRARDAGTAAVALTFSPHPVRFFSPGARFYEITTREEKAELIARTGIDVLVVESFDGATGHMWPKEFAREILWRVITSYSIHYTKLYDGPVRREEYRRGGPGVEMRASARLRHRCGGAGVRHGGDLRNVQGT